MFAFGFISGAVALIIALLVAGYILARRAVTGR